MATYAPGRWEIVSYKRIRGFQGTSIALDGSTVDENGCFFWALKGISGHRAPTVDFISDPMPNIPGEKLLFVHTKPRDIGIPILIQGPSPAAIETAVGNFTNAINSHHQIQVRVTNDNGNTRTLYCRLQSGLETPETIEVRGKYHNVHTIHFVAHDPYWYDAEDTYYTQTYDTGPIEPWLTDVSDPDPYETGSIFKYSKWQMLSAGTIIDESAGGSVNPLSPVNTTWATTNTIRVTFPLSILTSAKNYAAPYIWTMAYPGVIRSFNAYVNVPGSSTTGKSGILYLKVGTTSVTGGEITLTSANTHNSLTWVKGTPVTANAAFNAGTNIIGVFAKTVTSFAGDHGSVTLEITVEPACQYTYAKQCAPAFAFNGWNGHCKTASTVSLTDNFSFEFMFYVDTQHNTTPRLLSGYETSPNDGWYVWLDTSTSKLTLTHYNNGTAILSAFPSVTSLTAGKYYHAVYTYSKAGGVNNLKLYLWSGTGTAPTTPDAQATFPTGFASYSKHNMYIGAEGVAHTYAFKGKAILLRYNSTTTLTGAQVQGNMNAEKWRISVPIAQSSPYYASGTYQGYTDHCCLHMFRSLNSTIDGTYTITNEGDEDAYPMWTIHGPGMTPTITNNWVDEEGNTGTATILFDYYIGKSDEVTIDTHPDTRGVTNLAGQRLYNYTDPLNRDLWALAPGENNITYLVPFCQDGSRVTMKYRQRYGGI